MRARRALLYMPGDDLYKINKGAGLGVDTVCMDMEDGVALNRKSEARSTILHALQQIDFGATEKLARINPVGSGLEDQDLDTVVPGRPDGIVVPKVRSGAQLQWVDARISSIEHQMGFDPGSIVLLAIIESAIAIVNLAEIASSVQRLQAIIFGSEDFAGDVGAIRTQDAYEVLYARSAVVTHAAAYQLQAIDMVYLDFRDAVGLRREALAGAHFGFSGKQVIHPNQVPIVQDAFTPTDEAIDQALRLMEAFQIYQQSGTGAFALDGKMVDAPLIKAAGNTLERARVAGKLVNTGN